MTAHAPWLPAKGAGGCPTLSWLIGFSLGLSMKGAGVERQLFQLAILGVLNKHDVSNS